MCVYDDDAFQERVNFAAGYIAQGRTSTRRFDTCFEMNDGDAVVAALFRRTEKAPQSKLAKNLPQYIRADQAREHSARLGPDLKIESANMNRFVIDETLSALNLWKAGIYDFVGKWTDPAGLVSVWVGA